MRQFIPVCAGAFFGTLAAAFIAAALGFLGADADGVPPTPGANPQLTEACDSLTRACVAIENATRELRDRPAVRGAPDEKPGATTATLEQAIAELTSALKAIQGQQQPNTQATQPSVPQSLRGLGDAASGKPRQRFLDFADAPTATKALLLQSYADIVSRFGVPVRVLRAQSQVVWSYKGGVVSFVDGYVVNVRLIR